MYALRLLLLLTLALLGALAPATHAQTPFATNLDFVAGITQHDDERILVVQGGESGNVLAFDPDGTALPNFASGIAGPVAVSQLADGRVLLSTAANQNVLVFAADGTPLPTFAEDIVLPLALTQLQDGRVLVTEPLVGNVLAFNADGTGRTPFASGLDFPDGVIQLQDGRALVAVSTDDGGGGLVRAFEPGGTALSDFGTSGSEPRAMTQLDDSRLLVADQAGSVLAFDVETTAGAFDLIQRLPVTPDYEDAINPGQGQIVEMPDGALGVVYIVRTPFEEFGPDRLFLTTSSDGATWSEPEELDVAQFYAGLSDVQAAVDEATGRLLVMYVRNVEERRLLYSDDSGTSWTNIPLPVFTSRPFVNVRSLAPAPGGGFAALLQLVSDDENEDQSLELTTSSDGLSWDAPQTILDGFIFGPPSIVQNSPTDFVVLYGELNFDFGVPWPILQITSTDGGATWSEPTEAFSSENTLGPRVDATRAANGTIWVIHTNSEDLFYRSSTDGGATWAEAERWTDNDLKTGTDVAPQISMLDGSPMVLFWATRPGVEFGQFYYGIPGVSQDPLIVSVEPVSGAVPDGLELGQNYPNPFQAATTISFSVTQPAPTTLVVYDLLGREVARLVEEMLPAGTYETHFDGADLASGVYLYRLVSGSASAQRRLTVIR